MDSTSQKDAIILRALTDAPQNGWSMAAIRRASASEGYTERMADALFTGSIGGATKYVSDLFDRRMMRQLESVDQEHLRVRDKIMTAVRMRLDLMAPYRDGLRVALAHWGRPLGTLRAASPLWRSADRIWVWAGDTATDYNRYTKRGLLSSVMASTTLFWLQDNSPQYAATRAFLERRIEGVLMIGKFLGNRKKVAA